MTTATVQLDLKKDLYRSLMAHGLLLVLSIVLSLLTNHFEMPWESSNSGQITVMESVVKVDVVSMPHMTIKELRAVDMSQVQLGKETVAEEKAAEVKEKEESAPENPEQPTLNENKPKKDFASMLKELSKKKTSSKSDSKSTFDAKAKGKLAQLVAEGNRLSQGNALTGQTSGEAGTFALYLSSLPDRVRPYWKLPSYLMNQGLRCRVRLFLSANGELLKTMITESSGNQEFDNRAVEAVKAAAPFAEVDQTIVSRAIRGDMVLGFPI